MFFRRDTPRPITFSDQLAKLRSAGFGVESAQGGKTLVTKGGLGALLSEETDGRPKIQDCGIMIGKELGVLTDLGYQKVFVTPGGKAVAALASYLHALHSFVEDVRESVGLISLYNESLGTTNERHLYDRVEERDHVSKPKPWERKSAARG